MMPPPLPLTAIQHARLDKVADKHPGAVVLWTDLQGVVVRLPDGQHLRVGPGGKARNLSDEEAQASLPSTPRE